MILYKLGTSIQITNIIEYGDIMQNEFDDICYYLKDINSNTYYTIICGDETYITKYKLLNENILIYDFDKHILYYNSNDKSNEMFLFVNLNKMICALENIKYSKNKMYMFYVNETEVSKINLLKNNKLSFVWHDTKTPRYVESNVPIEFKKINEYVILNNNVPTIEIKDQYNKVLELGATKDEAKVFKYKSNAFNKSEFSQRLNVLNNIIQKHK